MSIYILLTLTIITILISIASIFLFGDKMLHINSQDSFKRKLLKIAPFISVVITIIFYLLYNNTVKQNPVILNELGYYTNEKTDTVIQIKSDITLSRRDSLVDFISRFLSKKEDNTLSYFYADTVETYYLKKNFTLDQIRAERNKNKNQYPRTKIYINPQDIDISFKPGSITHTSAKVLYYKDSLKLPVEIVYVIKINKDNKVFYIKNYEPL